MTIRNVSVSSNAKIAWLHNAYAWECLVGYLIAVEKGGHVGSAHVMHKVVKHSLKVGQLFCEGEQSSVPFYATLFV